MANFYVYILTTKNHAVFYTGFTDDIWQRTQQHKEKSIPGFTSRYNVVKLVYFEEYEDGEEALHREKQVKRYKRAWKINLINKMNPEWRDLYEDFL